MPKVKIRCHLIHLYGGVMYSLLAFGHTLPEEEMFLVVEHQAVE